VSIWSSVNGNDPTIYDGGHGEEEEPNGWLDVAVSCIGGRVRVMIQDRDGEARISLDPSGLAELHRRIVIARQRLEGEQK
jgi:hypothetical protein